MQICKHLYVTTPPALFPPSLSPRLLLLPSFPPLAFPLGLPLPSLLCLLTDAFPSFSSSSTLLPFPCSHLVLEITSPFYPCPCFIRYMYLLLFFSNLFLRLSAYPHIIHDHLSFFPFLSLPPLLSLFLPPSPPPLLYNLPLLPSSDHTVD